MKVFLYTLSHAIRIVGQVTGLWLCNPCKNTVKKSIWNFIDIYPTQAFNFLNIFTEYGKIMADYTRRIERISKLLCRNVIVQRL